MENKKRGRLLPLAIFLTLIIIVGGTYAWLNLKIIGTKDNLLKSGNLELVLNEDNTEGISIEKAIPLPDSKGLETEGYTFTLQNNGAVNSNYIIYLDDLDLEEGQTRMNDKYVRYSLVKNDGEATTALLTTTGENPNRILDSGVIDANTENKYTLKVWMDKDADNSAMGTVFYARLRIETEQSSIVKNNLDIDIDSENPKIDLGEKDPSNYTFTSGDEEIVKVDSEGNIEIIGPGQTTITVVDKTTGEEKVYTINATKTLNVSYVKNVTGVSSIEKETDSCRLTEKGQTTCNITLPKIEVLDGYEAIGWNSENNQTTGYTPGEKYAISEDTTFYTITKKLGQTYIAVFNKNGTGVEALSSTRLSCTTDESYNDEEAQTTCDVTLPEITVKEGYTSIGWSSNKDATTGELPGATITLSSNAEYYAISKKDAIILKAKFYKNGAASLDGLTDEYIEKACSLDEVYNSEEQATSCNITTPEIVGSEATPIVIGYNTNKDAIVALVNSNEALTIKGGEEYYAITKKEAVKYSATFTKNGAAKQDSSTDAVITKTCNIAATYNGVEQATSCSVTSPVIEASSKTPTIIGYSLAADDYDKVIDHNTEVALTDNVIYYAQTKKDEVSYNVSYKVGSNVSAIGKTSDVCTIDATYNGEEQTTTCSIEGPSITPITGYTSVGWNEESGATTGDTMLALTKDSTFYANAVANSYTIEYYNGEEKIGTTGAKVDTAVELTSAEALGITKLGYTFKGWDTSSTATTVVYKDKEEVNNLSTSTGDIIKLYAIIVDDIKPVCSFSTPTEIQTAEELELTLTCTDEGSKLVNQTLQASDFTISNETNGSVLSVSEAVEVENGYQYTVTLKGLSVGEFNVSLNEDVIKDTAGNGNETTKSNDVVVNGITYTATFTSGEHVTGISSTTLSCTTTGSNLTCSITSPTITVEEDYVSAGWFDENNTFVAESEATITLNKNQTFTAKALELSASNITYDNTDTGINCTTAQCAIDEINEMIGE